jgi:hypothetical protein
VASIRLAPKLMSLKQAAERGLVALEHHAALLYEFPYRAHLPLEIFFHFQTLS